MATKNQTTYSCDEVVSELTSFYKFLVELYPRSSALKYTPPGGWPDVAGRLEEMTTLPLHVVTLAQISGGRDDYHIFLDTERGTTTYCDFQDGGQPWQR